jgi:hypothetical protein
MQSAQQRSEPNRFDRGSLVEGHREDSERLQATPQPAELRVVNSAPTRPT